jgi:alkanesulfonate monooxygenase SsuD/methylene tetrahydromethanopterin reductase-like flavin-dependent oxidoreductase (luciferase family)
VQKPGVPIWVVADRNENGFKRVARLGDGWVTLAHTADQFAAARRKIDRYAQDHDRAGKCPVSALYATFNIQSDGERARREGWQWMEKFFQQPKEKISYHFTIFGTPQECADRLKGYPAAGLTTIVARIASDNVRGQSRLLLEELKPRLAS